MRPSPSVVACAFAAALLVAAPPAPAQDDPYTLRVNPFKSGLTGWDRTGSDKAFAWAADGATLTVKGIGSAKDPARLVYTKLAWDRGGIRFQAKKGAKKIRVVLQPVPTGSPISLEFPREAMGPGAWTDLALRLREGKALLLSAGADGKETERLSAEIPAATSFRMGFEAPSGTEAVLSAVSFVRVQEEEPQFAEEGFEKVFDGVSLDPWHVQPADAAPSFTVEKGVLHGANRGQQGVYLFLSPRYASYEMRLRALWGTTALTIRAVEFQGRDNQIDKFNTIQIDLGDRVDPEDVNDIRVRVADGTCTMTVNGKQILSDKVKPFTTTGVGLILVPGKLFHLRDIRIKDLSPGAAPPPKKKEEPAGERPKEDPDAIWSVKGAVTRDGATWTVSEPETIAGVVSKFSSATSYDFRFKVAKGAEGLSVVPRAARGVDRAAGIRIGEEHFSKEEWTEVVLTVRLLTAKVAVGGVEVGSLDLDEATGPPGIRVAAGGKATFKDLALTPLKK